MIEDRLGRARLSLEGLSVGDGLGGFFEFSPNNHLVKNRTLPSAPWRFTDDTNMALSIYAILRQYDEIKQDELAHSFAEHFDRLRGYGMGARTLLNRMKKGENWRDVSGQLFQGGSYGNGGAMRVAPLGAYFADDINRIPEQAKLSAEITHAHPEGVAGAIAVAVAAGVACGLDEKPSTAEFINAVLLHVPDSDVKRSIEKSLTLPTDAPASQVVEMLGNGSRVTAQDTAPFTLWMAATYLDDYEEAIWQTIGAGGDADTTAAMVGRIVALYTGAHGIPQDWLNPREQLPQWGFA